MCELAVENTSTWLMVDPWEAGQSEYQRTAVVLDHFDEMLNGRDGQGGVEMSERSGGGRRKFKIMLLAGGDLIESFGEPGVWSEPDVSRKRSPTRLRGRQLNTRLDWKAPCHSGPLRLSHR
jgi:nicotinamide mononucleotide adenylyltransferase